MSDTKHRGLWHKRTTQDNPREKTFAEFWEKEQKDGHILDSLLDVKHSSNPWTPLGPAPSSDRDKEVAATVIQWLGSNVGMDFLRQVINASPEIQRWFKAL